MSTSRALLSRVAPLWPRALGHPFVRAACDGELSADAVTRWVVNDYHFNVEYQRFVAGLITIAPTARATEMMANGLVSNQAGYDRLKMLARDLDIGAGGLGGGADAGGAARVRAGDPLRAAVLERVVHGRDLVSRRRT